MAVAPLTAADVADRVSSDRGWSVQTVKTLLSRLMAKDIIAADQDGPVIPVCWRAL